MMRTRLLLLGCAPLMGLALLSGCGGDDRLSEKEFRSQANDLCTEAENDTDDIGDRIDDNATKAEVEEAIGDLVDRTQTLVGDIRALDEPESLTKEVDAMLDAVTAAVKKIEDADIEELPSMKDPFEDSNKKAEDLGLDDCAD